MKILFVAALHHPAELQAAIASTPAGETAPLFPPSMSQYFWERALRRRGHDLAVFYRNLPASGQLRAHHHREGLTPEKVLTALSQRIPPAINPEYRRRNAKLLHQAQDFKPDVLWLVGDNTVITPETLRAIKESTGCTLVYASGTSPIVFSRPIEREAAPLYDLVLVNDYYHGIQWLELGAQRMECLPISAVDPDFHHPYRASDLLSAARSPSSARWSRPGSTAAAWRPWLRCAISTWGSGASMRSRPCCVPFCAARPWARRCCGRFAQVR